MGKKGLLTIAATCALLTVGAIASRNEIKRFVRDAQKTVELVAPRIAPEKDYVKVTRDIGGYGLNVFYRKQDVASAKLIDTSTNKEMDITQKLLHGTNLGDGDYSKTIYFNRGDLGVSGGKLDPNHNYRLEVLDRAGRKMYFSED